jgi:arylformamidase
MTIHDISLTISPDMTVWPGDPAVSLRRIASMDAGRHANVSELTCGVHTGTHVDAPNHFLNDDRTVESLPLDVLVGPARVVELPESVRVVTAEALQAADIPAGTLRLLLKTRNSQIWASGDLHFHPDFVGVSKDGADWLVAHGVRLIGIDYLSVSPYKQSVPTHQALLQPGMVVLEGADLSRVPPGAYQLVCLPLKLAGSDGAPARAILID